MRASIFAKKASDMSRKDTISMDREVNERRYAALLNSFSLMLRKDKVRFIFLSKDNRFNRSEKIYTLTKELKKKGLLEHYLIDAWFKTGIDYPRSLQGHQWGPEATRALAGRLHSILAER